MYILSRLLLLLALLSTAARAASSCVVLQYHHIDERTPPSTSVSPGRFAQHLQLIEDLGLQVLPLRQVVSRLRQGRSLPDRCVALSFDDAYESVYRNAWPLLRDRGWPFSVFVPSESIDRKRHPYMSWEQLRELAAAGVAIENHSHGHSHLIRRRPGEAREQWLRRVSRDLERAQRRIGEEIGIRPRLLAWPYGEYLPEFGPLLERLGLTGFGQQSGPASAFGGFLALPRFPVSGVYSRLDDLPVKLLSLPLPLSRVEPASPLLPAGQLRPRLRLVFPPGLDTETLHRGLNCFVDGSSEVELVWETTRQLRVQPRFDLQPGRHRSNCTLPAASPGRFHWYSHPWFLRRADASWYPE